MDSLVIVEVQSSTRAFHDQGWGETAQHRSLVVFGWVELRDDRIVLVHKLCFACWANTCAPNRIRET